MYCIGSLCQADIESIENWTFDLSTDQESLLTESGREENRQLGQRFIQRLPDLLGTYSEESFKVFYKYKEASKLK